MDAADVLAESQPGRVPLPAAGDPECELWVVLPAVLAGLSEEARALVRDEIAHVADIVAFLHRVTPVTRR